MKEILSSAVRSSKAVYQEFKAFSSSFIANASHSPYSDAEVVRLLREKLRKEARLPEPKDNLRILLLASIHNWESDLLIPLRQLGELHHFGWKSTAYFENEADWTAYRTQINKDMRAFYDNLVKDGPIDVIVGYCSDFNTMPETLAHMRDKGSILLNFCWDDKLYFKGRHKGQNTGVGRIAPIIDINLTNAPSSISKYQGVGALAMFWPEGANPSQGNLDGIRVREDIDALFIGGRYGWRGEFVEKLMNRGLNILAYGNGWPNGTVTNEELQKHYLESPVVLGFSGVGYSKNLLCLKGRDFEVPMAGGLYLTQANPELSLVYEIGSEILTYGDLDDCVEKILWVKQHRDEAWRIREAGFQRAMREHSWKKRFEDIFRICNLTK